MAFRDFKTRGIRVGRLFGIDIWIHWLLLLWILYDFFSIWVRPELGAEHFGYQALSTAATFLIILLHEYGHCYAAYRVGGSASAVVLWPLGGLAHCDAPMTPRAQFWVALGGPLVNVAIAVVLLIVFLTPIVPDNTAIFGSGGANPGYLLSFLLGMFQWNLVLLVFNLLPIHPLDGGRILQTILWGRSQSYGNATLKIIWITRISLVILVFLTIFGLADLLRFNRWFVFIIVIWAYIQTEQLRMSLLQAAEDGGSFGYDFSRGYSSLDNTADARPARPRKPTWRERRQMKREAKEKERKAEIRKRVDGLLDKISREGMNSLTEAERRFLQEASGDM